MHAPCVWSAVCRLQFRHQPKHLCLNYVNEKLHALSAAACTPVFDAQLPISDQPIWVVSNEMNVRYKHNKSNQSRQKSRGIHTLICSKTMCRKHATVIKPSLMPRLPLPRCSSGVCGIGQRVFGHSSFASTRTSGIAHPHDLQGI